MAGGAWGNIGVVGTPNATARASKSFGGTLGELLGSGLKEYANYKLNELKYQNLLKQGYTPEQAKHALWIDDESLREKTLGEFPHIGEETGENTPQEEAFDQYAMGNGEQEQQGQQPDIRELLSRGGMTPGSDLMRMLQQSVTEQRAQRPAEVQPEAQAEIQAPPKTKPSQPSGRFGGAAGTKEITPYQQTQIDAKEKARLTKINTPKITKLNEKAKEYEDLARESKRVKELLIDPEVKTGAYYGWLLNKFGEGALNGKSQELLSRATKLAALATKAQTRGVTGRYVEQMGQLQKPNIIKDKAASLSLINSFLDEAGEVEARKQALRSIKSPELQEDLDNILDTKEKEILSGVVDQLPPASQAKGKGYENEDGTVSYSDGNKWKTISMAEYRKIRGK